MIAEEKKLVCPWLSTTLVGDDGTRVAAFESCYREACPYWGVVKVRIKEGRPAGIWGYRRVATVASDV